MLDDDDREPTPDELQADRDMLMAAIGEALGAHLLGMDGPDGMSDAEWDELFGTMDDDE